MSKQEILSTPIGEMMDMLACFSIVEGGAEPKKKHKMTMEELLRLN